MADVPTSIFTTTIARVFKTGNRGLSCDFFVCTNRAKYKLEANVEGMRAVSRVCDGCYRYLIEHKTRDWSKAARDASVHALADKGLRRSDPRLRNRVHDLAERPR